MGTKISALTEETAPNSTDMMVVVNGGVTQKVQIANVVKAGTAIWARVYHNANQSTATGANTVLAFNSERADTSAMHDTVTNNSRLTCTVAGAYTITASVEFAANATGARSVGIRLNGTTFIAIQRSQSPGASLAALLTVTTIYALALTDYVEVVVSQDSGGALNAVTQPNYSPEFEMARLGA